MDPSHPVHGLDVLPPKRIVALKGARAYLVFRPEAEGMLLTKWQAASEEAPPSAVAVFATEQSVPAYRLHEPARELIRGFRGTAGKGAFFMGFAQFVEQCRRAHGTLELLTPSVQLFFRRRDGAILRVLPDQLASCDGISAVACVGPHRYRGGSGPSPRATELTTPAPASRTRRAPRSRSRPSFGSSRARAPRSSWGRDAVDGAGFVVNLFKERRLRLTPPSDGTSTRR